LSDKGPNDATNVRVTDLLPAGLTFLGAAPSQGTYDPATGAWVVGTVDPGSARTLVLTARVDSPAGQTNTATISHADQFDPNTGNNTSSVTETPEQADLAVTKSVSNATPNVGDTVTFTIQVSDLGPNTATHVQIHDLLPAGLMFLSATPSQGAYDPASGLWSVGTVTTSIEKLVLHARVDSPDALSNVATITGADQFDPNLRNNSATATETPQQADLSLAKTVDNPTPNVGGTITFTITLTNAGPAGATGVKVTDLLPAGLTFVSATPSQGTYSALTGVWIVGTVGAATSRTLALRALVASPDAITNVAVISAADQFDPNPGNNQAVATETPQQADLSLTKTVDNSRPNVGSTITFTVTLSNAGTDAATNVHVSDLLPAGLSFVSATPAQGTYNSATGSGSWAPSPPAPR